MVRSKITRYKKKQKNVIHIIKLKRNLSTNKMHMLKKLSNTTDLEIPSYVINLYIGQHACHQGHRQ